jgi:hypothetical protein
MFTAAKTIGVGTKPSFVAVGDFNGDGRQDFATANNYTDNVSVRLGACVPAGTLQFSAANYDTLEGNAGSHFVTVTVTRMGGPQGAISVHYATADGTATDGSDYQGTSGDLTWADGDSASKTFDVLISGDAMAEQDETINLALSNPTGGAMLGTPATATVSILDDDTPVDVNISDAFVAEPTAGTSTATFTVTLSGAHRAPVTVDYSIIDGTASAASGDYDSFPTQTLTFMPGVNSQTISVTVHADNETENPETFFVNLSNASANANIVDGHGVGTITDPAQAGQLLISEFRFNGSAGALDEFIELQNITNSPLTVAASDGSAGWAVVTSDNTTTPKFVIPAGTVIPAHGHYLGTNVLQGTMKPEAPDGGVGGSGYSLNNYAAPDVIFTTDIPSDAGIALFSTARAASFDAAHRLDAVGFAGVADALYREGAGLLPAGGTPELVELSWVRNLRAVLRHECDGATRRGGAGRLRLQSG